MITTSMHGVEEIEVSKWIDRVDKTVKTRYVIRFASGQGDSTIYVKDLDMLREALKSENIRTKK